MGGHIAGLRQCFRVEGLPTGQHLHDIPLVVHDTDAPFANDVKRFAPCTVRMNDVFVLQNVHFFRALADLGHDRPPPCSVHDIGHVQKRNGRQHGFHHVQPQQLLHRAQQPIETLFVQRQTHHVVAGGHAIGGPGFVCDQCPFPKVTPCLQRDGDGPTAVVLFLFVVGDEARDHARFNHVKHLTYVAVIHNDVPSLKLRDFHGFRDAFQLHVGQFPQQVHGRQRFFGAVDGFLAGVLQQMSKRQSVQGPDFTGFFALARGGAGAIVQQGQFTKGLPSGKTDDFLAMDVDVVGASFNDVKEIPRVPLFDQFVPRRHRPSFHAIDHFLHVFGTQGFKDKILFQRTFNQGSFRR